MWFNNNQPLQRLINGKEFTIESTIATVDLDLKIT